MIQAQLVEATTGEQGAKSDRQKAVAASLAAANAAAVKRRQEEIRLAREFFDTADKKTREDLVRKFVASSTMGLRAIERQMLKPGNVTEANIMTLPDVANTFSSYVAGEIRKATRVRPRNS